MTDPKTNGGGDGKTRPARRDLSAGRELLALPGLAFISLYLLALAGVIVLGVVAGRHYPPLFLVFAACFLSASGGLAMLLRWAWALALAAVFLLAVYNLWTFASLHQGAALVQGLLNLVFFLYLVRPEVREKLR
jgi:asparagine N-glycosylation enzyme membrane subunit Stt3